jgi:hypothetical protein
MGYAEKTIERIKKEQTKLESLLTKKEEFTANYQEKLAEMNKGINEQKKLIDSLKEQEKQEKLDVVATLASKNGLSVDDLLHAIASGDFYGIQEKLENKTNPKENITTESKLEEIENLSNENSEENDTVE